MSSFFGSGPLPDWKEIREWLGKDMPWKQVEEWEKADQNGDWVDRIVKGLLRVQEESVKASTQSSVSVETIKQAKKVTVTIRIPPGTSLRELRLFATPERMRVSGLPGGASHTVRFPCLVYPRSGTAEQYGDRLVVEFRRRRANSGEVELFIRN